MKEESYVCDCGCGARKQQSNHWWVMVLTPRGSKHTIELGPWGDGIAEQKGVIHLAGRDCVIKLVERFMETGSLEQRKVSAPADTERAQVRRVEAQG